MVFYGFLYGFLWFSDHQTPASPQFAEGIDIFHFSNLLDSSLRRLGPFLVDVTWAGRAQCLARGDKHGGVLNI